MKLPPGTTPPAGAPRGSAVRGVQGLPTCRAGPSAPAWRALGAGLLPGGGGEQGRRLWEEMETGMHMGPEPHGPETERLRRVGERQGPVAFKG